MAMTIDNPIQIMNNLPIEVTCEIILKLKPREHPPFLNKELFSCVSCGLEIDRDATGSRNIYDYFFRNEFLYQQL